MSETLPTIREAPERPPPRDAIEALMNEEPRPAGAPLNEPPPEPPPPDPAGASQAAPPATEAPAEAPEQGGETAAPEAPQEPEPLNLTAKPDPELEAWLDEPDFDAEAEAELQVAPEAEAEEDFSYETAEDDALREERRKRIAAEKKAAHYEGLRAKDAQKAWAIEAKEHFPLAEHALDSITATSRREYLREARDEHNRLAPVVAGYLERAGVVITEEAMKIAQDARAAAEAQYGKPTAGPGSVPVEAAEKSGRLAAAREEAGKTGSLRNLFKTMMREGV